MDNHKLRLILGFVIAVLVLTAVFMLLPKTALIVTTYCFSLLGPVMLFGTLWIVASGTKNQYLTNAAFPLQAWSYCVLELLACVIFVLLDQTGKWSIQAGWFTVIHIVLIAIFSWRVLAMKSGQEVIEQVGRDVQLKTADWRMIGADVEALKGDAPEACRKELQAVIDAIRYADPVTCPELKPLDEAIRADVLQLELKIKESKAEEVPPICLEIRKRIKERAARAKILK